ncbi:MAG TPA: SDR family NAD(P)-dependent oxidoreductase [Anaerolineae bacterium]
MLTSSGRRNSILIGVGISGAALAYAWRRLLTIRARNAWQWSSASGKSNVAVVTGSSSGIGLTFARRLARQKNDLILVARREEKLAEVAVELHEEFGVSVEVIAADLTNLADLERVEARLELLDNLELLVNCAGFGLTERFANSDIDKQAKMVSLHTMAIMRLTRASLPGMLARRHGGIINVSSMAAFFPFRAMSTIRPRKRTSIRSRWRSMPNYAGLACAYRHSARALPIQSFTASSRTTVATVCRKSCG